MVKRFDELGAMLFSEQLRRLADALSAISASTVRNDLGRVTQLAFLLSAASVQEAAGVLLSQLAAPHAPPHLTPREAGRALLLRVEFVQAEVRQLLGL